MSLKPNLNFKFAVISDPHIALPETITQKPNRFHLLEVSIPAIESILKHLAQVDLDFLLLPGDLTSDGEPENHHWLVEKLSKLHFPSYVVPGNHDIPTIKPSNRSIGMKDFPQIYKKFGYESSSEMYYIKEILPGIKLVGLNSTQFDIIGKQQGYVDENQLVWLKNELSQSKNKLTLAMIHHNVIEHMPGQSQHELGKRYMLQNADALKQVLHEYQVPLLFTGHLHVQSIVNERNLYEITTGSVVSYPHPYRIINCVNGKLKIESHRVTSIPGWNNLPQTSKEWMGERSYAFMMRLLTLPPLQLSSTEAEKLVPHLKYFWADIAAGDAEFDLSNFPKVARDYFQSFTSEKLIDNSVELSLTDDS